MDADGLAGQGARASVAMALTYLSGNIMISATKSLSFPKACFTNSLSQIGAYISNFIP